MYRVGIITLSDKAYQKIREDASAPCIMEVLASEGYKENFKAERYTLLPDEKDRLTEELRYMADSLRLDLILTTGGTGFSPRDITPEASLEVAERNAPGIAEAIRAFSMKITKTAMLSRAVSVIRKESLIINLPGSPKAVREILEYILPVLVHGIEVLRGRVSECAPIKEKEK